MPSAAVSEAEILALEREARSYADEHITVWPDVDAFVANLAEEVTFADPTWGDDQTSRGDIIGMWRQFEALTNYEIQVGDTYVSLDGVAYEESWPGLQPPIPLPLDPPLASGLTVYGFDEGKTVSLDLWYLAEDNAAYGIGCFAVDRCPALRDTVDRYVAAWSSRDPGAVAALYNADAVFTDSLMGLEAKGERAIGDLADIRFGSTGNLSLEVLDTYVWTDDRYPPTEANPGHGQLIGVALHYVARLTDGEVSRIQDGVVTLVLGSRDEGGVEADPHGLIHHEVAYHDPSVLLSDIEA